MKLAVLFASILCLAGTPLRASVIVAASPVLQTVAPGSTAQVQVDISGLLQNAAPSVGAYDLDVYFNPLVLSFAGLTLGDPVLGDQLDLSGIGTVNDSLLSTGVLEFYEVSLDSTAVLNSQQADHFVLATLQFKAISAGSSSIVPVLNALSDAQGGTIAAAMQSGQVDVVATPEPSGLLILGLGAVVGFIHRERSIRADRTRRNIELTSCADGSSEVRHTR